MAGERGGMTIDIKTLSGFELFADMTEDELSALASILTPKSFHENDVLIEVDTMGDEIYFIRNGMVGN